MSMSFALRPRSGGLGADATGTLGASAKLTPQRAPPHRRHQAGVAQQTGIGGGLGCRGGAEGAPMLTVLLRCVCRPGSGDGEGSCVQVSGAGGMWGKGRGRDRRGSTPG